MSTMVVTESGRIPPWVEDLASFRKWVHSGEVPERGRFGFLAGVLWMDLTMERLIQPPQDGHRCSPHMAL